jgi:hypothetical protein
MALDKYVKLELRVRAAYRQFWVEKLSTGKQKPLIFPGYEIPRGGSVDLVLAPTVGTVICVLQRSDYVAAYKHTVGQTIGTLVHYHRMTDREVREAVRASQAHPDYAELKQGSFDELKVSKRLLTDAKEGEITLALVTELPEVPQQARELEANFFPIADLLQSWLPGAVKKKKLCKSFESYAVNPNVEPPTMALLTEALKPMLKPAR